jgi:hypothetical protein
MLITQVEIEYFEKQIQNWSLYSDTKKIQEFEKTKKIILGMIRTTKREMKENIYARWNLALEQKLLADTMLLAHIKQDIRKIQTPLT